MISIIVNKNTRIIQSTLLTDSLVLPEKLSESTPTMMFGFFVQEDDLELITLEDGDPRLTPDIVELFQNNKCFKLLFVDNEFKTRPFITTEIVEPHSVMKNTTTPLLKVDVEYNVKIEYHDPDNISYDKQFTDIKVKDRADFITVPALVQLDDNKQVFFKIKSSYPGVAKIRAKDTKYLCYFEPLLVRFKQGI